MSGPGAGGGGSRRPAAAFYRRLVEQAQDVFFAMDTSGVVTWCSPRVSRYGYRPQDVVGKTYLEFVAPEDRAFVEEDWRRTLATGREHPIEFRFLGLSGERFWVEELGNILRDGRGRALGLAGCVRFVGDRRTAEDENRRMERELRHGQRMQAIGQLAGGIAHDFNNVLSPILGFAELALRDVDGDATLSSYLTTIRNSARRAAGLIRQLLVFSRKDTDSRQVADLNAVVDEFSLLARRLIGEDVTLEVILGKDVGAVPLAEAQLEQILLNLAINARDAMPRGGALRIRTGRVEAGETDCAGVPGLCPGEYVSVIVEDTGVGMSPDVVEHIFEPFFSTKHEGGGTGLGLTMVSEVVRGARGVVQAESRPGEGSTFTLLLPRVVVADAATESPVVTGAMARGSETVLVVEDEVTVLSLVCTVLRQHGFRVLAETTGTGGETAAAAAGYRVDLLLSDVVLPGLSGPELHRTLLRQRPGMPVLFMSGHGDADLARYGLSRTGSPIVEKPFTVSDLVARVRAAIDGVS